MQVHKDINALPVFQNAVVTIGTFDGVHRGHRQIINQLKAQAAAVAGETVIITFHPHPRMVVGAASDPIYLINTLEEKTDLLEKQGIDHLVVIPFTTDFANQSATEYIEDFLIQKFHPHTLIIGYDHRFGKGRSGDFHLLEAYAATFHFHLIEIPQHLLHESAISSTRIREAIKNNEILVANELLGYRYFFEGTVMEGNKLGRTIGFPTANLEIKDKEKLVPGNGVYAVLADPGRIPGMMNIGIRPTIGGTKRVIEVNLFDFDSDIYGKTLQIQLVQFLRAEEKFANLDSLKQQLRTDRVEAIKALLEQKFS